MKTIFKISVIVFALIILGCTGGGVQQTGSSPKQKITLSDKEKRTTKAAVEKLQESGILVRSSGDRFWVNERMWYAMNRDQKESFASICRLYREGYSIRILSYKDDSPLANMDEEGVISIF